MSETINTVKQAILAAIVEYQTVVDDATRSVWEALVNAGRVYQGILDDAKGSGFSTVSEARKLVHEIVATVLDNPSETRVKNHVSDACKAFRLATLKPDIADVAGFNAKAARALGTVITGKPDDEARVAIERTLNSALEHLAEPDTTTTSLNTAINAVRDSRSSRSRSGPVREVVTPPTLDKALRSIDFRNADPTVAGNMDATSMARLVAKALQVARFAVQCEAHYRETHGLDAKEYTLETL